MVVLEIYNNKFMTKVKLINLKQEKNYLGYKLVSISIALLGPNSISPKVKEVIKLITLITKKLIAKNTN